MTAPSWLYALWLAPGALAGPSSTAETGSTGDTGSPSTGDTGVVESPLPGPPDSGVPSAMDSGLPPTTDPAASAAALAGEVGGCHCTTGPQAPPAPVLALVVALTLGGALRRRRTQ